MPSFEYKAQGSDGAPVSGVIFGVTIDQAMRDLGARGLQITQIGLAQRLNDPLAAVPVAVPAAAPTAAPVSPVASARPVERPAAEQEYTGPAPDSLYATTTSTPLGEYAPPVAKRSYIASSVLGPLVGTVALTHLVFFFRQAATMFRAGVPIVQSLTTLSGQTSSPKFRGIIREMAGHVEAGRPISAGMQRYPEVFSSVIVSIVRAGEEGGFLDEAMAAVADYLEKEIALRNLYKRATFMPKLTVVVSMLIVLVTNLILGSLASNFRLWSPLTEGKTWAWLGPLLIGLFLFLRVGLANGAVKYVWDLAISNFPYIGGTLRQIAMARFGRTFGALYRGGIPMVRALQLSADASGNEFLRARMHPAYKGLEQGKGVTETFRATHAFNPIVLDMVQTGEATGNLDEMLNKVAEYYEDEAATRSQKTGQVVGVALIVIVAIYVLIMLINFYTSFYGGIINDGTKE